jgi:hypothetical protein
VCGLCKRPWRPIGLRDIEASTLSRPVVPNLWYAYPWGYAEIILVMAENTKKKEVKIRVKTQKQSYEVFGLQRETYVKVVTRPSHH